MFKLFLDSFLLFLKSISFGSSLIFLNILAFQEAQSGISQSLGRLLMVSENYPALRASENFKELQVQLEGTENRIKVARNKFNEATTQYNIVIRKFPASIFAGIFGFDKKPTFQADASAQNAPTVNFN